MRYSPTKQESRFKSEPSMNYFASRAHDLLSGAYLDVYIDVPSFGGEEEIRGGGGVAVASA
jgi:hypothetical protein